MAYYTQTDRNGNPNVFNVEHNDSGLWLDNNWAKPDNRWNADNKIVFSLRKYYLSRTSIKSVRFFLSGFLKLFFQPLNILPTSSNFREISSYCLWEISFASQETEMRNLRVSKIKMHSEIFFDF